MGYLVPRIGSKHSIALLGLPQLTAWFCMIFGTNAFYLYAARFFLGVTCLFYLLLFEKWLYIT